MEKILLLNESVQPNSIADIINNIATDFHIYTDIYQSNIYEKISDNPLFDCNEFVDEIRKTYSDLCNEYDYVIVLSDKPFNDAGCIFYFEGIVVFSTFSCSTASSLNENIINAIIFRICLIYSCNFPHLLLADIPPYESESDFLDSLVRSLNRSEILKEYKQLVSVIAGEQLFATDHIVVLSHGIRTRAYWSDSAKELLEERGFIVEKVSFGIINSIMFMSGLRLKKLSNKYINKLDNITKNNPNKSISIITHSYGTYIAWTALKEASNIGLSLKIQNFILNSSIITESFNWDFFYNNKSVSINRIVNICGDNDSCPLLAKKFLLNSNMGSSGTFFFDEPDHITLSNYRLDSTDHHSIVDPKNCKQYWIKYLLQDSWEPKNGGIYPSKRIQRLDWLLTYVNPKIFWLAIVLIIVLIFLL